MFVITSGAIRLPLAFQADPNNPGSVRPFEYAYHSIIAQRGNVTITNNVIHPANGESAYLHYVMPKTGKISIMVFTLSGDIVNVLANGTQNAGEYTTGGTGRTGAAGSWHGASTLSAWWVRDSTRSGRCSWSDSLRTAASCG